MRNKSTIISLLSWIAVIAFAYACETKAAEEKPEVQSLKNKRDSLVQRQEQIKQQLDQIDKKLAKLDTSRKLYKVTTYTAEVDSFKHYFDVYGSVEADKNIMLYPEANGTIKNILVQEGDEVSAGQALARLDTKVIEKSIQELETQYELAQTMYEKRKNLWEQNIGSEVEYLEAENRVSTLEANLARLREQRDQAVVKAPFGGVVDQIFPKEGEMANPASPIMRLVNLGEVYIEAEVAETYLSRVSKGTPVKVELPSVDKTELSKVIQVGNYINPNNRTFEVRVSLPDKMENVKPNMMTMLHVQDYETDSAIVLPNRMIQQTPDGKDFVYILNPNENDRTGTVKKQMVITGKSYREKMEIKSGLKAGDIVVDRGSRSVKDNQIVELAEEK